MFPDFYGIPNSRFNNSGDLVFYRKTLVKARAGTEETSRKTVNFALAGVGDLSPKGVTKDKSLTGFYLTEDKTTFPAVLFYSQATFDLLANSAETKLEWNSQPYTIKEFSDFRGFKVYIVLNLIHRAFSTG